MKLNKCHLISAICVFFGQALINQGENIVYRLDTVTGKTYTLRIHRSGYHTLSKLNAGQQWTTALDQAGIAVQLPKMTKEGAGYACVPLPNSNETRYVGISEWLDGILLREILKQTTDKTELTQIFHQLGANRCHDPQSGRQLANSQGLPTPFI